MTDSMTQRALVFNYATATARLAEENGIATTRIAGVMTAGALRRCWPTASAG